MSFAQGIPSADTTSRGSDRVAPALTATGGVPVPDGVDRSRHWRSTAPSRIARRAAWPVAGAAVAMAAGTVVLGVLNRDIAAGRDAADWLRSSASAVLIAAPAGLIASRRPANPIGWLLLGAAFLLALAGFGTQYGVFALATHPGLPGGRWALWLTRSTAVLDVVPPLILLLFPAGTLLSRRWRPVAWTTVLAGLSLAVVGAVHPQALISIPRTRELRHITNPLGITSGRQVLDLLMAVSVLASLGCLIAALIALGVRYRRAEGIERAQLKWFAFAGAVLVVYLVTGPMLPAPVDRVFGIASTAMLSAAMTIAILRYRLFDIDVIVNRTLVYGALSAAVVGLYIAVVVGFGALVNAKSSLAVALLATGVIAAGFSPARTRLQEAVDRLMYRDRPDPYRVLARLGERLAATAVPEEVLPGLASTVAETLRLPYVAIETGGPDGGITLASHGSATAGQVALPLTYQNQRVGTLVAGRRGPEDFSPTERELLSDLARQAGVAVHAVALTSDLHRSRERLVVTREEERRRVRRDLHDGLGPTLAAITVRADAARRVVRTNPEAAEAALLAIKEQAQLAVADVRRLVQGLRPPALDELGLAGAIRAQAERFAPGVEVEVVVDEPLGALAAGVEVAAYRIADEALTNAIKHARAQRVCVRLTRHERMLEIEVTDDGVGFDPTTATSGLGLSTMVERAEELGGSCRVLAAEPNGAVVLAALPLIPSDEEP